MIETTQDSRVRYQRTSTPGAVPRVGSKGALITHPTRGRTAGCPTRRVGDIDRTASMESLSRMLQGVRRRSNCRRPYEMNPPSGWGTGRCMREKVGRAHPTSHCGQVAFSPLESLVGWALPTSHVRTGVQAVKHGRDTHATHAANTRPPRSVR